MAMMMILFYSHHCEIIRKIIENYWRVQPATFDGNASESRVRFVFSLFVSPSRGSFSVRLAGLHFYDRPIFPLHRPPKRQQKKEEAEGRRDRNKKSRVRSPTTLPTPP